MMICTRYIVAYKQGFGNRKMIIYHGSNEVVKQPKILQSERMLDFGAGFYTTSNREQAIRWAKRVAERRESNDKLISVYEFDLETAKREVSILRFDEPDEAWLDFVCLNRSGREVTKPYDIVFGPVANDQVYRVIQFYENGVYDKTEAIRRLKVEKLFDQILFHTERALVYCRFKDFKRLGALYDGNQDV
jgi:hypothetical protein